jgi:hypothetical protein
MRKRPVARKVLVAGLTVAAAAVLVGAVPDMVRYVKIAMM